MEGRLRPSNLARPALGASEPFGWRTALVILKPETVIVKGYQIRADGLKLIFTERLGPPAATDHAPPPTGDPSARRR